MKTATAINCLKSNTSLPPINFRWYMSEVLRSGFEVTPVKREREDREENDLCQQFFSATLPQHI